ncbi:MAG: UDP-N-acetylmuramoyl-L-alanyl-D-glutamate--2,6-diaminopimelate ligase [Candidatus Algichlamydia australiensis]|nr:UDP-N-acetylmuramoyl-L-alanyl-D-glutamate--2,6-diaminopimelate ligase [Chlamydiales bacterium]
MKLKKLFKGIPKVSIKGAKEVEISGISVHSKLVKPGNLFIAKRGVSDDGARYIDEAVVAGAKAVLTDIYDPFLSGVTQVIHPDPASIEAQVATIYYDDPSLHLFTVGITGTNGKTTTSYLVKHLLDAEGEFCGLLGTIEYIIGKKHLPAPLTTPDNITLQSLLSEIRSRRYASAVMEVSSHGLKQGRVDGIDFDVAIFTNISRDHLDYHQNFEDYFHAKSKLFRDLSPQKTAIINIDDSAAQKIRVLTKAKILTYGIENCADLQASEITFREKYMSFCVTFEGEKAHVKTLLMGRFNIYNILAAIAVGLTRNIPLIECAAAVSTFKFVRGRLEPVKNSRGISIYIDFAHSDDALKNVLKTLRECKKGKIITVFGCGGMRDRTKRPKMAQVAEKESDYTIVTSDNPRGEDPLAICLEIAKGFASKKSYCVEVDRKTAIERAIQMAQKVDVVLIAGKGHENTQILDHKTIEFDDKEVARSALKNLH